jgi:hypothetical protein
VLTTIVSAVVLALKLLLLLLLLPPAPHLHLSPSEQSFVRKRAGCMWYSNTLWDWGHASPRGQVPCKSTATCFSVHVAHSSHHGLTGDIAGVNNCSTMRVSAAIDSVLLPGLCRALLMLRLCND